MGCADGCGVGKNCPQQNQANLTVKEDEINFFILPICAFFRYVKNVYCFCGLFTVES